MCIGNSQPDSIKQHPYLYKYYNIIIIQDIVLFYSWLEGTKPVSILWRNKCLELEKNYC